MHGTTADQRFGVAWLMFAVSVACHVMDEAAHDFLSVYNPNAMYLRSHYSLPVPTFTFREWIVGLSAAVLLLLVLTPLAWRGSRWFRVLAIPLGLLVGIGNGLGHIASSLYFWRMMPGVISAPVIIATGMLLVVAAREASRKALVADAFIDSLAGSLAGESSLADARDREHRDDEAR